LGRSRTLNKKLTDETLQMACLRNIILVGDAAQVGISEIDLGLMSVWSCEMMDGTNNRGICLQRASVGNEAYHNFQ